MLKASHLICKAVNRATKDTTLTDFKEDVIASKDLVKIIAYILPNMPLEQKLFYLSGFCCTLTDCTHRPLPNQGNSNPIKTSFVLNALRDYQYLEKIISSINNPAGLEFCNLVKLCILCFNNQHISGKLINKYRGYSCS